MPKIYKNGEIPPYKTKEYYKLKMREYRKKNPINQTRTLWSITINNKKYVFKTKKDMNISKITSKDVDKNKDVICF